MSKRARIAYSTLATIERAPARPPKRPFRDRPAEPYRIHSLRIPRTRRDWLSLAASSSLHLLLILLVIGAFSWTHRDKKKGNEPMPARLFDPSRQVQMVYVAPPQAQRTPQPAISPAAPGPSPTPAPVGRYSPVPEPEANATADEKPQEATAPASNLPETPDARSAAASQPTPIPQAQPKEVAEASNLESEAQRIFGKPRTRTGDNAGAESVRPFASATPDQAGGCPVISRPPADSSSPPQMGTVVGRIFRKSDGKPLQGAHLQIIGTQFATFTNERGEYSLTFEVSLLDHCRTQYVQVTAPGYESRMLVLLAGRNLPSEDVLLRRQ